MYTHMYLYVMAHIYTVHIYYIPQNTKYIYIYICRERDYQIHICSGTYLIAYVRILAHLISHRITVLHIGQLAILCDMVLSRPDPSYLILSYYRML